MYDKGREGFLDGSIDFDTDDIRLALVDTASYTFSASHQFRTSLSGAEVANLSSGLGSKTVTSGVANSAAGVFTAVSGASVEAIVMYKHTGSAATDRLIAYWDSGSGLPITPNGGDITVNPNGGSDKWFKL